MVRIGDKVRFVSEVGGGRVAGFGKGGVVMVEDEDGFQIPTAPSDLIVVDDSASAAQRKASAVPAPAKQPAPVRHASDAPAPKSSMGCGAADTVASTNQLTAALAYVPMTKTGGVNSWETYFVNDCNYHIHFSYLVETAPGRWQLRYAAEVEPNTQVYIEDAAASFLGDIKRVAVQLTAYKTDMPFALKPAITAVHRVDVIKMCQRRGEADNPYFEQKAYIFPVVTADKTEEGEATAADSLARDLKDKLRQDRTAGAASPARKDKRGTTAADIPVLDLHAAELLDTFAGMTPAAILDYQLTQARRFLDRHSKERGRKVVLIHGKGEGVLREAVIRMVRKDFPTAKYHDASFREYGFGATEVVM